MIFQSLKLLLLYKFNRFIHAFYGQPFFFWSKLEQFPYMGGVSFFRDLVQVLTIFGLSVICPVYFQPHQGTLFHLSDFLRHAV